MIFIGVGSSIGDSEQVFDQAEIWLELSGIDIIQKSKVLKNPPIGGVAQNDFHNAVWEINFPETTWEKINWILLPRSRKLKLKAKKLLKLLKQCEQEHGRVKTERWADRPLDLDILMFHDLVMRQKALTIPHTEISKRTFVLQPWRELVDDDFEIPTLGILKDL